MVAKSCELPRTSSQPLTSLPHSALMHSMIPSSASFLLLKKFWAHALLRLFALTAPSIWNNLQIFPWLILTTFKPFTESNLIISKRFTLITIWNLIFTPLGIRHLPNAALVFLCSQPFLSCNLSYNFSIISLAYFLFPPPASTRMWAPQDQGFLFLSLLGPHKCLKQRQAHNMCSKSNNAWSPLLSLLTGCYIPYHYLTLLFKPHPPPLPSPLEPDDYGLSWQNADCSHRLPSLPRFFIPSPSLKAR